MSPIYVTPYPEFVAHLCIAEQVTVALAAAGGDNHIAHCRAPDRCAGYDAARVDRHGTRGQRG